MSKLDSKLAKEMLVMLNKSGVDSPAARTLALDLQKVALTPGAIATDLAGNPGLMARLAQAARYVIAGVTPATWFGPGQPLAPQAGKEDDGTRGRRYDFGVSSNLNYTPRSEGAAGGVPFNVLRNLGDGYDLLRLVIETRKDQVSSYQWEITPKDGDADDGAFKDEIKRVTEFFEQPTPELDWLEWLRAIVEDDLVCGSIALYPRASRGGQLHSIVPVDVGTIKKMIDAQGYTPLPPSPAYQQILKGSPAVDYTSEELVYWMRNPRTWKLYGYGPVEQVLVTVNIAMRRQQFMMEYYTEGNIPDMILGVPDTWTPDQIKEFQTWWDSILSGNTAMRRRTRFMPEVKNVILPKDSKEILTDSADEWLARIVCFAFSIAPTALIKMTNRAQSEQVAETAKEEGLLPFLNWLARKLTYIANVWLEAPNVKFAFKLTNEIDPKVAADIRRDDVKAALISVDEARIDMGRAPAGMPDLVMMTATGPVPLREGLDRAKKDALNPPAPPPVQQTSAATPKDEGKPADENKDRVVKVDVHLGDTHISSPVNLPAIKVDAPKLGDTHVHVTPAGAPDVFVNVDNRGTLEKKAA